MRDRLRMEDDGGDCRRVRRGRSPCLAWGGCLARRRRRLGGRSRDVTWRRRRGWAWRAGWNWTRARGDRVGRPRRRDGRGGWSRRRRWPDVAGRGRRGWRDERRPRIRSAGRRRPVRQAAEPHAECDPDEDEIDDPEREDETE